MSWRDDFKLAVYYAARASVKDEHARGPFGDDTHRRCIAKIEGFYSRVMAVANHLEEPECWHILAVEILGAEE